MSRSGSREALKFPVVLSTLMFGCDATPSQAQVAQAVEDLSIGRVEGASEYTFASVAGLAVTGDGSIWVLDQGDSMVKGYDRDGRFLRKLGGSGRGPGEFVRPTEIAAYGDTIAVYDPAIGRLTFFDASGRLLTTADVAVATSFTRGLEPLGDGTFVLGAAAGNSMPPNPQRDGKVWLVRVDQNGAVLDTLLIAEGAGQLVERTPETMVAAAAPFQRSPAWSVAPDGRIGFGTSDAFEITFYQYASSPTSRASAAVRGTLVKDVPNRIATRADREAYEDRLFESAGESEMVLRAYRRMVDKLEYPETWPAFRTLRFDDRGHLWVERERPTAEHDRSVWEIFDASGSMVGSVSVDGDVRVKAIRDSYIYGIRKDSLGVDYVKRLRVERL